MIMFIKKTGFAVVALAAAMSCTAFAASPVAKVQGTVGDVPFPDKERSYLTKGDFVNVENLRQVRSGLSKDQVRLLLGNPHFREGLFGVSEWNYIFNFHTGNGDEYITCQYQVRYAKRNEGYRAESMHWNGPACMELANREPEPVEVAATPLLPRYNLAADALFRFDHSGANDILPGGLEKLNEVSESLKQANPAPTKVKVIGHADRLGSSTHNDDLSKRRAETVKEYLIANGVNTPIEAEGRGDRQQVKQCRDGASREVLIACLVPNRRVELIVEGLR